MLLYHYTNAKGLHGILESKKLWASSYQFLNDTTEFEYAFGLIKDVYPQEDSNPSKEGMTHFEIAEMIGKERHNYNSDSLFVVSFSKKKDLLSQWQAYAGPYSGYSLGFRQSTLDVYKNEKFVECNLVECNYDNDKQLEDIKCLIGKLSEEINAFYKLTPESGEQNKRNGVDKIISQSVKANKEMLLLAKFFKNSSFKHEKEWRLVIGPLPENSEEICYRPTKRTVIPYVKIHFKPKLPIERIVVGPGPHQKRSAHSLKQMLKLKKFGLENVEVSESEIPYRNW
jgi:hypothetical protein